MKKIFPPTLLFFILISCNDSGDKKINEVAKIGDCKIVGIYIKRDGTKVLDILFRRIYDRIRTDSIANVKTVVTDTLYGFPITIKQVDGSGNILKTKSGLDSINPQPAYIPISKDSVIWRIQGVPVDLLLKIN